MAESVAGLVSKSEFARMRGCSPALVTKWKKLGRIVLVGDKVDVEKTDARLAATLDPARGGKGGVPRSRGQQKAKPEPESGPKLETFDHHRTRRESFTAAQAEMDYLERSGKLVERDKYDRAWLDAMAPVMASLDRLAPTLGPQVTGETDARKVQNRIDDAVDQIRRDMESTIRAMLTGKRQ